MRIFLITCLCVTLLLETQSGTGRLGPQTAFAGDALAESTGGFNVSDLNFIHGDENVSNINLPLKTSGGGQFWTDHLWKSGYHVQQNAITGHWRLLDRNNVRRSWGSKFQCVEALNEIAEDESSKHFVVLLHGLMRTSGSMKPLQDKFTQLGYEVVPFSYASTRAPIGEHAAALREVLEHLPADAQFSFSGHSMGNIVVRHLVGDLERDGDPKGILPRCRSMVMLGPPNQGAAIARKFAKTGLFGIVTGKGGMELGPNWSDLMDKLSTPSFPFAIVAGDLSDYKVKNPMVAGQSDFVVSLDEAKLDGVEEFETLPVLHSFLMNDQRAVDFTVEYIRSKHPIGQ
ncbi:esterase/lipase family protein [Stieleria varia]|uniref:Alpha/beta hydrolase family protein n=1 Tax=Stieleria varia TaxID=2528005 RepID=A0A5C6A502_9BACT|nr:lipase [Stieleria varia]TWT94516.1 Alpha/beta hydrolase family protein [Stieleria varia]